MASKQPIDLNKVKDLSKVWDQLTDEQKEKVYQECEGLRLEDTRPLTPQERSRFERAIGRSGQRGRGRPKIGHGARRISVTVEKHLLGRADQFAKQHGLSRAEVIARGLELALCRSA